MVSSINVNLYGSSGVQSFSFGSYGSIDKTDTEVFEDVFQDAMDATGADTQKTTIQNNKIDMTLGIPAGLEIEGIEKVQASIQSKETSEISSSKDGDTSSSEEEDFDEMDLNKDGTVTAAERVAYERMQQDIGENHNKHSQSITDLFEMNAGSIANAISAYSAA